MTINATIIGQAISFILFVLFCMKFVWPPLIAAIENRQKAIADGLSYAEQAKKDLEIAEANSSDALNSAKMEARNIIELANKSRTKILEEAQVEATKEKEKILAQGLAEIESERRRAQDELRKHVAILAVAGAEKIIERSVDEAANNDIINKIISEL